MLLLAPSLHAVDYLREVKPVLKSHCYACHGALKQKAGLRLDTTTAIKRGGESGDATKLLLQRVMTTDKSEHMPPEGEGSALNADELAHLQAWLNAGAPAPAGEEPEPNPRSHWAYQSPKSSQASIDSLIEARLAQQGLTAQPAASAEVWLRRVYLDLIGLPPTAAEISAFAADNSPAARQRVVDHLLSLPQYGERWGRHFMDIWRYCDWYGLGAQLRHSQKHLWHWRDWIVESLNADKGYDRMIVQMLAADEAAPEDRENLRATGFLARSYYLFNRTTWLDETIEHTARAFLGVTMQCVKCHDHKYDPIEQADYYRMRAVFEPMHVRLDPWPGEPDFEKNGLPRVFDLHLDKATYLHRRGDEMNEDKTKAMLPGVPAVLDFASFTPTAVTLPRVAVQPSRLPFVVDDHLRAAKNDAAKLAMVKATIAADLNPALAAKAAAAEAAYKLKVAEAALKVKPSVKGAKDDVAKAKRKVASPGTQYTPLRASLKAQEGPEETTNADVQTYPATSTGRRLAFAEWIADERHPLTARVLVNQVWMRHFCVPIVADVSDFGRRASPPLHQDVLDTLAADFMQSGWSMKQLHRRIVLSAAYARSSSNAAADASTLSRDPDNAYLWRMNPRRIESQVVRDAMLHIAGTLDLTIGGPSLPADTSEASPRRSLYFTQTADTEHRFLATFDNANVLECYRRNDSVVPQQALALTNSKLSRECADALAKKLSSLSDADFVREAFVSVLGRAPSDDEQRALAESLGHLPRPLVLQALLNHNDFVTLR